MELKFHDNRVVLTYLTAKMGQSHFSSFMASKIMYVEASNLALTHLYSKCLDPQCFSSWLGYFWPSGGHKHSQQSLPPTESFQNFFLHVLRYELESWYIYGHGNGQHWVNGQTTGVHIYPWPKCGSQKVHTSHAIVKLIRLDIWSASLGSWYKPSLAGSRSLSVDLSLDLSTDHRACSQHTS